MDFLGGSAIAISAICLPFVTPALRRYCLPYVPATTKQLQNVQTALILYGHQRGSRLVDIGSGDGRIVHLAAQQGYLSHGIELNPWLVLYSKYRSIRLGLRRYATFSKQDLWKSHFGGYPNVVIFGVEQMVRVSAYCLMNGNGILFVCFYHISPFYSFYFLHLQSRK